MAAKSTPVLMAILPAWMDDGARFAWAASVTLEANALSKPCTPESVKACALNAGYLGLQFGKQLGYAYMVPFFNKDLQSYEATLVVGYQGFVELAFNCGFMAKVSANVVCKGESFEMWTDETGSHFRHVPEQDRFPDRGNITGAYCVYSLKDGNTDFVYVSRQELDKSDRNRDVWKSDYAAMCKKTSVRRAAKFWKKTKYLAHAVYIDEQEDRGERQSVPVEHSGFIAEQQRGRIEVKMSLEEFEANVMRCKTTDDLESIEASLDKLSSADRQSGLDIYDRRYAMFSAVE